jgi:hypothetical protein
VYIAKPGTPEQRPLSIPAVRDRVVQAALKIVLEPIFEAEFAPCSYGFRPKRGQHDALQVLVDETWRGRRFDGLLLFGAHPEVKSAVRFVAYGFPLRTAVIAAPQARPT